MRADQQYGYSTVISYIFSIVTQYEYAIWLNIIKHFSQHC